MIWLLLVLQLATAAGLILLAGRLRRRGRGNPLSEEEAQAEAFLAATVERFLRDLQESASRATVTLQTQAEALQALLAQADERLAATPPPAAAVPAPERRPAKRVRAAAGASGQHSGWPQRARELSESGLPPLQIAKRIGRGEEEVRLVLATAQAKG